VVTTPAERAREGEMIILRGGRVVTVDGSAVMIEFDGSRPEAGEARARAVAAQALGQEAPRHGDTDQTVVIRRIEPSAGGGGGGLEIRLEDDTAAEAARGRAVHGLERGRVASYDREADTEVLVLDEPSSSVTGGTILNVSKTRSGKACVLIGTIGTPVDSCVDRQ
jgi:hypothetical protein